MDYNKGVQLGSGYAGNLAQTSAVEALESASWIRDATSQSEQLLSDLHEQLNRLEQRLDTVLTPSAPSPATTNSVAPKNPTPIGSHLRGRVAILNEGWQHAIERINQLRSRIEI